MPSHPGEQAPSSGDPDTGRSAIWRQLLLRVAVLVVIIATLGYWAFTHYREGLIEESGESLLLIAQQKADGISALLQERYQDALLLSQREGTERLLAGELAGAAEAQERNGTRRALTSVAQVYGYRRAMLVGRDLTVDMSTTPETTLLPEVANAIRRAMEAGSARFVGFHHPQGQPSDVAVYGAIQPVFGGTGRSRRVVGAVYVEREGRRFIFPFVLHWPLGSRSGAAVLIAREADGITVVSPLRPGMAPLALRVPASDARSALVRVAAAPGIHQGIDDRGAPVLAAGVDISDTNLSVVTTMELAQIQRPLRAVGGGLLALSITLAISAAWIVRNQLVLQLQRGQARWAQLNERYAWLTRYANDMIMLTDEHGNIVEFNERVGENYGYSRAELQAMNATDFRAPGAKDDTLAQRAALTSKDAVLYRTEHRRKDGSVFPVEISMRKIHTGGREYVLAVVRDISQLVQRERLYDAAIGSALDGFIAYDTSGRIREANRAAADLLGYSTEALCRMHTRDFALVDGSFDDLVADIRSGRVRRYDATCIRQDGNRIVVEVSTHFVDFGPGMCIAFLRDVTNKREEEAKARRTAQLYAFRAEFSDILLREHDLAVLLREGCRIAVEIGGFRMAWGGLVDKVKNEVRPLVHFGASSGYVEQLCISLGDDRQAVGPSATALREGRHVIANDVATDPSMLPWREAALARGFRSSGAFPIVVRGEPQAVISLYAGTSGYFGEFELHLIGQMAVDIGLAWELDEIGKALRMSQEHLLQAQAVGGIGSWTFDVATGEVSASEEAVRIFALDQSPVHVDALFASVHPDDLGRVRQQWGAALDGTFYEAEYRLVVQGELRWISVRGHPEKGRDGQVVRVIGVVQDVTERRRTEGELESYRLRLEERVAERTRDLELANEKLQVASREQRAVFDTAPGGIVLMRDRIILNCNERMDEMFGYARGEQIGKPTRIWYPDDASYAEVGRDIAQALGRAGQHAREVQFVRKDGSRFWARTTGRALDPADPDKGMVGVIQDITEEREAADTLRLAKQTAEEASQAKSAFLANMSHEIRTPMNAIVGFAHLLRRDPLTVRQVEHLDKMTMAAKHLLQVINDILDVSKIEAGKVVLEQADFELMPVIDNVRTLLQEQARSKGLELAVTVQKEGLPLMLHGDGMRLEQILLNLAGNAIKFTEKGHVSLAVAVEQATDHDIRLRFEVADTGIGISPEQMARLFRAFEQADTSTTRRFGGSGLGLVICKRLVELMDGQIQVESVPGQGTRFWFDAKFGRTNAQPAPRANFATLRGMRALVVDDDEDARQLISEYLAGMGLRAAAVASGERALAELASADRQDDPYQVLVVDWKMPGMDGVDMVLRVHALGLAREPEFLMATAYGNLLSRDEALRAGIQKVLAKPVTPSDLHAALLELQAVVEASAGSGGTSAERSLQRYAGARILLVEDNAINQEVASGLLASAGLEVDVAGNGLVALEKVRDRKYDLILMDVQMPVMDGLQATVAIRRLPGMAALPIIAMTANAFAEDRARCLEAGMNDHVAKPVNPDALYATVGQWLARVTTPLARAAAVPPVAQVPDGSGRNFDDLRARLAGLDGLDVAAGLKPTRGLMDVYVKLLGRFAEGHAGDAALLAHQVEGGDLEGARLTAHALKGVAATLGVTRVHDLALRLEQELRADVQPGTLERTLGGLSAELLRVTSALRALLAEVPGDQPVPAPAPSWREVAAALDRIIPLLESDDTAAADEYDQVRVMLRDALGPVADDIRKRIDGFDFTAALAALRAVRETRPELKDIPPTGAAVTAPR